MGALEIFECEQGTPEWHACRCGIVTASEMHKLLMNGRGGAPSKTRRDYMLRVLGERMTGQVISTWGGNEHTERGHALEPEARALYAFLHDVTPKQIGFMRRGRIGASPDSLVGDDGLLEIKTKLPHLLLDCVLSKAVPEEHLPQIQTQLWVSGRSWCDFFAYWPGLPPFVQRVQRDEEYIGQLDAALTKFYEELDAMEQQVLNYQEAA